MNQHLPNSYDTACFCADQDPPPDISPDSPAEFPDVTALAAAEAAASCDQHRRYTGGTAGQGSCRQSLLWRRTEADPLSHDE